MEWKGVEGSWEVSGILVREETGESVVHGKIEVLERMRDLILIIIILAQISNILMFTVSKKNNNIIL